MFIKCSKNYGELEFSEQKGLLQADGSEYFRVTIRGNNLSAFSQVYAFDPFNNSLQKFFEELAENWKGWNGEKKWASLEGELSLVCTSDNLGHIEIEVTIYDVWSVQHVIYVDAGQLENIALDVKKFFAK